MLYSILYDVYISKLNEKDKKKTIVSAYNTFFFNCHKTKRDFSKGFVLYFFPEQSFYTQIYTRGT